MRGNETDIWYRKSPLKHISKIKTQFLVSAVAMLTRLWFREQGTLLEVHFVPVLFGGHLRYFLAFVTSEGPMTNRWMKESNVSGYFPLGFFNSRRRELLAPFSSSSLKKSRLVGGQFPDFSLSQENDLKYAFRSQRSLVVFLCLFWWAEKGLSFNIVFFGIIQTHIVCDIPRIT